MVSEGCLQGYNGVCVGVSRVQWCVKGVCNGVLGVTMVCEECVQWCPGGAAGCGCSPSVAGDSSQ